MKRLLHEAHHRWVRRALLRSLGYPEKTDRLANKYAWVSNGDVPQIVRVLVVERWNQAVRQNDVHEQDHLLHTWACLDFAVHTF